MTGKGAFRLPLWKPQRGLCPHRRGQGSGVKERAPAPGRGGTSCLSDVCCCCQSRFAASPVVASGLLPGCSLGAWRPFCDLLAPAPLDSFNWLRQWEIVAGVTGASGCCACFCSTHDASLPAGTAVSLALALGTETSVNGSSLSCHLAVSPLCHRTWSKKIPAVPTYFKKRSRRPGAVFCRKTPSQNDDVRF